MERLESQALKLRRGASTSNDEIQEAPGLFEEGVLSCHQPPEFTWNGTQWNPSLISLECATVHDVFFIRFIPFKKRMSLGHT